MGVAHLQQRLPGRGAQGCVESVGLHQVAIEVVVLVDVGHGFGRERPVLQPTDGAHHGNVVACGTLRVQAQRLGNAQFQLDHKVGKEHHLTVITPPPAVGEHAFLHFVHVHGDDAHRGVVVDDGAFGRHQPVLEEETRAVAVHVAHEDVGCRLAVHVVANAVAHAPGGAVGKRQAEHVAVDHAAGVRPSDAFGQYLRLAAARRGQHQMAACLRVDDALLGVVGRPPGCGRVLHGWKRLCF